MSQLEDLSFSPTEFCGKARLFPLPNLVLFPNVLQPLHIFEDRYREMLDDALEQDQLIAMSLLQPGWETEYDARPPVYEHACLGKVATHQRLDDGRYNLLLLGVGRIRIVRELPPLRSFREVEAELIEDVHPDSSSEHRRGLRTTLVESMKKLVNCPPSTSQLEEVIERDLPLGALADTIGYALDLDLAFKQRLLAELNVEHRAEMLTEQLEQLATHGATIAQNNEFPPRFSEN